jgi:hypothetical protein
MGDIGPQRKIFDVLSAREAFAAVGTAPTLSPGARGGAADPIPSPEPAPTPDPGPVPSPEPVPQPPSVIAR